jgi:uncharacterized membrane protein
MWLIFAAGAAVAIALSDFMRKLGSNLNDPFLNNLFFQIGAVSTAIILWLIFSRTFESNVRGIHYALLGGMFISIFTVLLFKALEAGSLSTVVPVVRIGAVLIVVVLGLFLFKEKLTWELGLGIILALGGVYLIFSAK